MKSKGFKIVVGVLVVLVVVLGGLLAIKNMGLADGADATQADGTVTDGSGMAMPADSGIVTVPAD